MCIACIRAGYQGKYLVRRRFCLSTVSSSGRAGLDCSTIECTCSTEEAGVEVEAEGEVEVEDGAGSVACNGGWLKCCMINE